MTTEFQGAEIVISRTGYSGEFGYEVYLAIARLAIVSGTCAPKASSVPPTTECGNVSCAASCFESRTMMNAPKAKKRRSRSDEVRLTRQPANDFNAQRVACVHRRSKCRREPIHSGCCFPCCDRFVPKKFAAGPLRKLRERQHFDRQCSEEERVDTMKYNACGEEGVSLNPASASHES